MAGRIGIIEPCRPWLSWVGLHCLWGVDGRLSVRVLDTFGPYGPALLLAPHVTVQESDQPAITDDRLAQRPFQRLIRLRPPLDYGPFFRWQNEKMPLSAPPQPLPLPDKRSIAVLPFQNMSGDPEQEYFADGMVEEIISSSA